MQMKTLAKELDPMLAPNPKIDSPMLEAANYEMECRDRYMKENDLRPYMALLDFRDFDQ